MFIHNIDPVFLSLGFIHIHYYGLVYALGALGGYSSLVWRKNQLGLTKDECSDYMTYILVGMIIGARLVYALFYNGAHYLLHPFELFMVWKGGMSFHGGLLGVFLGGVLWCKRNKHEWLKMADASIVPFALVLAFGRLANFINGELYGAITTLPWGVNFSGEKNTFGELIYRHPSQLYEMGKNLFIFGTLLFIGKRKAGTQFFTFLVMYGILRFFIEFIRLPDPQLGHIIGFLSMGQLLCIPMVIIGAFGLWRIQHPVSQDKRAHK